MSLSKSDPPAEFSMTPAMFHILLCLADGEKHGYAIMQEVDRRTDGEVQLPPGTLYRSLQKLLEAGLVLTDAPAEPAASHDTRRRGYRITRQGRQAAGDEARRLGRLVGIAVSKNLLDRSELA